ncbi:MAG: DAK2 domain-containing protein [Defluviitaleaceae bacterium]|nr:DAK2 domain-containing protein [Defluviitaleaceae bacterium]
MANEQRITKIDGRTLRAMIIAGANKLTANKVRIDALNVYPVPDGDTGTNMSLTVLAAAREVEKLDTDDIFDVSKAAASGALRGGRGNSGVIFSQLFRGFSKALDGKKTAGCVDIAQGFVGASITAYKAVMRPQEGTMLTVARCMGEYAEANAAKTRDIETFLNDILTEGNVVLQKTPDMLPVLKQAGVVDSGGEGLLCFLQGAIEGMHAENPRVDANAAQSQEVTADFSTLGAINPEDITFGYCTEFFITAQNFGGAAETRFKAYLETMGDSIALVADDEIVKVHIHTDHPGAVMEKAMLIGPLDNIKIDNMRSQHQEITQESPIAAQAVEEKELGIVAVSSGEGFREIFIGLGADYVIEGGQTMNPSAEDIARGIKQINAKNVIVLPNNKNIVLAAQQAVYLCEGINVAVVGSKSMPQGISALINYMPEGDLDENAQAMTEALDTVATGQVTYAVRDTTMDGQEVREGDYIGILNGKIVCTHEKMDVTAKKLVTEMMASEPDVLTVYIGEEAKGNEDANAEIEAFVVQNYGGCEFEIAYGGQAVYYYILSAE